ncbi:MAG: IS21 family transposase [Candidatus Sabulitectum sp.]|nr:IS21 family transposase [Candidatus Sabulitectum sp.]
MARKRAEVRMIREILRLHFEAGYSNRAISQICGKSRPTVQSIHSAVEKAGYTWPLPDELDDAKLEAIVYPRKTYAKEWPLPDWEYTWRQMQRKGTTLKLLWLRYKDEHSAGYQYSQYCEHYNRWCGKKKVSMRKEYRAGVNTEVDYAGSTLPLTNPVTGEIKQVPVFVGVLGVSSYLYAEATLTMKSADWIGSHMRMFEFYGGATEIITPDNPKTGVKRPCRYDPDIQRTYENMVRHYGAVVMPARVRKPRDKPKVERGVLEVLRWIIAVLRDRVFFSLEEMNEVILEELEKINNKPFTDRDGSRRSLFEELDKPLLKPLPSTHFTFEEWKKVKVHIDYHVQIYYCFYSVPYQLAGKTLTARITGTTVELFNKEQRVATHMRQTVKGRPSTLMEHMPEKHSRYLKMTPEKILNWTSRVGERASELAGTILKRKDHPAQGYRVILGIMSLGRKYGEDRLENACGMALKMNSLRLRDLKMILEKELDISLFDGIEEEEEPIIHGNIRGKKLLKKGKPNADISDNRPAQRP